MMFGLMDIKTDGCGELLQAGMSELMQCKLFWDILDQLDLVARVLRGNLFSDEFTS